MSYRRVNVPQVGEVLLSKRHGAKHLRLSITAKGEIRVSMPAWAPYSAGIAFAKSRAEWIAKQLKQHSTGLINSGARIGRFHRIEFSQTSGLPVVKISIKNNVIGVRSSLPIGSPEVQKKLVTACEKALRIEAVEVLPQRLNMLADTHGFRYKDVHIRKLVSRWGSCSRDKDITLSYFLMQLPEELADYVLLHELNHTKHLHHGADFWSALKQILPDARARQKQIRDYKSQVQPF